MASIDPKTKEIVTVGRRKRDELAFLPPVSGG